MGKSLEFCVERASDAAVSSYADRDWTNAEEEIETLAIFEGSIFFGKKAFEPDNTIKYELCTKDDNGNQSYINFRLKYDPFNTEFDYFTSASACHDGTLLFIQELFDSVAKRVVLGGTYNKNMREPKDGDTVQYTFGNFVYLNEYGEQFATEEKPWLQERTTVLLPLKMEIV